MAEQTTSVLEQIAANIETTLATLAVVMPDGTTKNVTTERKKVRTQPVHLKAVIFQDSGAKNDDAPLNTDEWVQPFAVVVYVMPVETDATPVDSYNNAIIGAMHRALMTDYQRAGLAVNTIVNAPLFFPPIAGEFAGIVFNFDVVYRTSLDDPFVSAT